MMDLKIGKLDGIEYLLQYMEMESLNPILFTLLFS